MDNAEKPRPSKLTGIGLIVKILAILPLQYDTRPQKCIRNMGEATVNADEKRGILHTRRHLANSPIFKGIPNFRPTRIAILRAETMAELTAILEEVRQMM